jgi:Leucine-rich repeat (LRR) protein
MCDRLGAESTPDRISKEREEDRTTTLLDKLKIKFRKDKTTLKYIKNDVVSDPEKLSDLIYAHPDQKLITHLVINRCTLKVLPVNIGLMEALKVLDLSSNALEELPWSIVLLKRLETLNLSDNLFRRLPKIVCSLRGLGKLNVDYNILYTLPTALLQLENLTKLDTQNNKLPSSISNKTVADIFKELRKRSVRKNEWEHSRRYQQMSTWVGSTNY